MVPAPWLLLLLGLLGGFLFGQCLASDLCSSECVTKHCVHEYSSPVDALPAVCRWSARLPCRLRLTNTALRERAAPVFLLLPVFHCAPFWGVVLECDFFSLPGLWFYSFFVRLHNRWCVSARIFTRTMVFVLSLLSLLLLLLLLLALVLMPW